MSLPVALSASPETLVLTAALAAAGFSSSFIGGVLGAGGGLVGIPILHFIFCQMGLTSAEAMQMTVGTTSFSMILSSALLSWKERKSPDIAWQPMLHWIIPVILGVTVAHLLGLGQNGDAMKLAFACVVTGVALYMSFGREEWRLFDEVPIGPVWWTMGVAFGLVCSLVGIGGGIIIIPLFVACGVSLRKAITSSMLLGLMIGLPASAFYLNMPTMDLPFTIGYVNMLAVVVLVAANFFGRPLGLWVQHKIPPQTLKRAFSAVLILTATRLFWTTLA